MRAERRFNLLISNKDVNAFIKIIKSLEDLGLLTAGVTEAEKQEIKSNKVDFLVLWYHLLWLH